MPSPQVLDLDRLLAPVSPDNPGGENLRWDPIYDEIKQARREDSRDPLIGDGAGQANWRLVVDKTSEVIAQRSKDLMLAAYLLEAALQLHGFAGFRDGLRLVNGLLEQFWEGMHPQVDGDDLEPRAAPVVWFSEADRGSRLPNRIRDIPLTPSANGVPGCSWSFWKSRYIQPKGESEDESGYARRREEAESRGKQFEDAVAGAPLAHFAALNDDIRECAAELSRLGALLDQRFGRAAPGTSALRTALEECGALVARVVKDKGGVEPEAGTPGEEGASPESGAGPVAAGAVSGPIKSRADALRRLGEVAAYLRQTEPHSPVSYLVERAAQWGQMSLEQLLEELVKDSTAREQIGELLGLRRRE